jgi:flagellar biosynthesis/type III secretory pathway protein FliH
MIETNLGDIDARIEKQLRAVEAALKSEFQKSNFTNSCLLK